MNRAILLGLLLCPSLAFAEGAKQFQPISIYQDEGNSTLPYSVQCDSNTWTVLVSSDAISRSLLMYAPHDNPNASTDSICISTITTAGYTCTASTPGTELRAGASLTDHGSTAWRCRGRANNASLGYIKGYRSRDTNDQGRVGIP